MPGIHAITCTLTFSSWPRTLGGGSLEWINTHVFHHQMFSRLRHRDRRSQTDGSKVKKIKMNALRYWADRWLDSFFNTLTLSQNCAAISSCRENCCIIFRSWKQCRWWTCCCSAKHRWIAATPVALRPCMRQQRTAMFQWCASALTSVKLVQRGYHGHHVIIACRLARCKSHNSSLGNG